MAWLLVTAGVVGASARLLSSPELTVAAVALAGWATVWIVVKIRRVARSQETPRGEVA